MHSIDPIFVWVHGTPVRDGVKGKEMKAAVTIRANESLEAAIGRGATYVLDGLEEPANRLTNVWFDSIDFFDFERFEPLMDPQFPGQLTERSQRP